MRIEGTCVPAKKRTIDRDKLRAAIRRLGNQYVYDMLDDAIELLPPSKLAKLVGKYLDVKSLESAPKGEKQFLEQFDVPACLVEAAAEVSPDLAETPETDFRPLVAKLSREECDGFLCRVAQGDAAVGLELRKRLHALMPLQPAAPEVRRSIGELLKRADAIEAARKVRQERAARRKHEAEMQALAERETDTWRQVAALVDLKQIKSYDEAVQVLGKLRQLAEFRGAHSPSTCSFRRRWRSVVKPM